MWDIRKCQLEVTKSYKLPLDVIPLPISIFLRHILAIHTTTIHKGHARHAAHSVSIKSKSQEEAQEGNFTTWEDVVSIVCGTLPVDELIGG